MIMRKLTSILIAMALFAAIPACKPEQLPAQKDTSEFPEIPEDPDKPVDPLDPEDPEALTETGEATDVTVWSATLSAYAHPTPTMGLVTMGILYSTEEEPTLENGVSLTAVSADEDGKYTVLAEELASNTTYYFVSFVEAGGEYHFGEVKNFTTSEIEAGVITVNPSGIGLHKATLNGDLEGDLEQFPKFVWFLYSTEANTVEVLKTSGTKIDIGQVDYTGSFQYTLENLEENTTYYYIAAAKIYDTEFYAEEVLSFTTNELGNLVTVTTGEADGIKFFQGTVHGSVALEGEDLSVEEVWFLYSYSADTLDKLLQSGTRANAELQGNGTFNASLESLFMYEKYYYVACAKVGGRVFYGEVKNFMTLKLDDYVTVETFDATSVGEESAVLHGKLTVTWNEPLETTVRFIYLDTEPTDIYSFIYGGTLLPATLQADGTYEATLSGLTSGKTYYFVANATVTGFSFCGEIFSFTTQTPPPPADKVLVTALTTRGFIKTEGSNSIYVYTSNAPSVSIGDEITCSGTETTYNGVAEITDPTYSIVSSGNTVTYPEPTDITASFDTFSSTKADFITFTGTLTKSSSYYNITVSGATVVGSLSYPAAYLNADNYNGKEIKVTGYYNGINGSGRYRYIIATKIEEVSTPGPGPGGDTLGWLELPSTPTAQGTLYKGSFFSGGARNYTYFYDTAYYASMVVAYPLCTSHLGGQRYDGGWMFNESIPENQQVDVTYYSYRVNVGQTNGDNYDSNQNYYARGHQIPDASRRAIYEMQSQTYYVTNSTPQIQDGFNDGMWSSLENAVRNFTYSTDTVYVATGPVYRKVGGSESITYIHPQPDPGKSVALPNYYWKAVLKVKRSGGTVTSASAIGFWFEHKVYLDNYGDKATNYYDYTVSVDKIEEWTGLDLFTNLPSSVAASAEANTNLDTFNAF